MSRLASTALVLAALFPAGCRKNPNYCEGAGCIDAARADASTVDAFVPPDGPPYRPVAVKFARAGTAGDYLTTDQLDGETDSPQGTYSVWIRFAAGSDNTEQLISAAEVILSGGVSRTSDNKIRLYIPSCLGQPRLDIRTINSYTAASGWVHILAAWDLSTGRAELFINGLSDIAAGGTTNSGNCCYQAGKWGIGGLANGKLDAEVADLYAALGTFIDIKDLEKRRLFRTDTGKPVDLGADCSKPTGAAKPTACLRGELATWHLDKGTGGGFTKFGELELATSNPAD